MKSYLLKAKSTGIAGIMYRHLDDTVLISSSSPRTTQMMVASIKLLSSVSCMIKVQILHNAGQ